MPVMPKGRYRIMTHYMPKVGTLGLDMMYRTCTVQANLDFSSEADMVKKLRVVAGAAAGRDRAVRQFAVHRRQAERLPVDALARSGAIPTTDRTGMLPFAFEPGMGFERYVDYALDVPMYFVKRGDTYHRRRRQVVPRSSRRQARRTAGRARRRSPIGPTTSRRSFPEVRLKRYLEMRGADGGPWRRLPSLPAFWVGLLYDDAALDAGWDLVKDWTAEERQKLRDDVPKLGFKAEIRGRNVLDAGAGNAAARRARAGAPQAARPRRPRRNALSRPLDEIVARGIDAGRGAARAIPRAVERSVDPISSDTSTTDALLTWPNPRPRRSRLQKAGVAFTLHEYDYDPNAERIGMQAAEALGIEPARLLKTLMARAGDEVVCVLAPSDREVNLKKLAAAAGAKSAADAAARPRPSASPAITSAAFRRSARRSARACSSSSRRSPFRPSSSMAAGAACRSNSRRPIWCACSTQRPADLAGMRKSPPAARPLAAARLSRSTRSPCWSGACPGSPCITRSGRSRRKCRSSGASPSPRR